MARSIARLRDSKSGAGACISFLIFCARSDTDTKCGLWGAGAVGVGFGVRGNVARVGGLVLGLLVPGFNRLSGTATATSVAVIWDMSNATATEMIARMTYCCMDF